MTEDVSPFNPPTQQPEKDPVSDATQPPNSAPQDAPSGQGAPVEFSSTDTRAIQAELASLRAQVASLTAAKPGYTGPVPETKGWGRATRRNEVEYWPVDSSLEFEHDVADQKTGEVTGQVRSRIPGAGIEHAGTAVFVKHSDGRMQLMSRADFEREYATEDNA